MKTNHVVKWFCLAGGLLLLASCNMPVRPTRQNMRVTELFTTRIAQTLEAGQVTAYPGIAETMTTPPPSNPSPTPTLQSSSTEVSPVTPSFTPQATSPEPQPSPTLQITTTQLSTTEASVTPAQPTPASLPNSSPTRTPTVTPTLAIPEAAIQIREPGPLSRIVTPLHLVAWAKPGGDDRVRVELFGEDGRLLVRKVLLFDSDEGHYFLNETLDFEIPGVAETARLEISTFDAYGRQSALVAQDLILLSIGENQVNPPGKLDEPVVIVEPRPNKLIQGGTTLISGQALPFNEQPLLVELIARDGRVVGYRQAFVPPSPDGSYMPFLAEIPYQVQSVTSARLTIKAYSSGRIPGIIYITSQEILLSP